MKTASVQLTLEPYLAKFVKYYMSKSDMVISNSDFIGPLVLAAISKAPPFYQHKKILSDNDLVLKVPFQPNYVRKRSTLYISKTNMIHINALIKKYYELAFSSHVMVGFGADNEKIISLIKEFRNKYDIDDSDLDFENSLKAFYRLRKRVRPQENLKKIVKVCPFFSELMDISLSSKKYVK